MRARSGASSATTRAGMARHMVGSFSLGLEALPGAAAGDPRLAEGEAPVVGRDRLRLDECEAAQGERRAQLAGEDCVEKAAAAAGDGGDARGVRGQRRPFGERGDERRVEQRGAVTRVPLGGQHRDERA